MTTRKWFWRLASLLLVVWLCFGSIATGSAVKVKIIALAGEINGNVVALDSLGALRMIRVSARGLVEGKLIGTLPPGFSPVDLGLFSMGRTDFAVVTMIMSSEKFPSNLCVFDLANRGKPQVVSLGPGLVTGVAPDPSRKRILIAESRQLAIMEVAPFPSERPKVRSLGKTITAMKTIGALVLHNEVRRLYCADPVGGTVYSIDPDSGNYSLLAPQLGEVRALCLDAQRATLYAADCARRCIWAVRLNQNSRVEPFGAGLNLKEPDGLAIEVSGNLWIADASLNVIHVVAPNGQLVRTLR